MTSSAESPQGGRRPTTSAEIAALVSRWREYAATLRRYDEAGLKGDRSERARAFEDAAHELEDAMKFKPAITGPTGDPLGAVEWHD